MTRSNATAARQYPTSDTPHYTMNRNGTRSPFRIRIYNYIKSHQVIDTFFEQV